MGCVGRIKKIVLFELISIRVLLGPNTSAYRIPLQCLKNCDLELQKNDTRGKHIGHTDWQTEIGLRYLIVALIGNADVRKLS